MNDLLIIGGGINGVGIARDAAGRGLKVVLAEKGDLGGATSSSSTKLIHGGLRYLEHYEFGLVRSALKEREILLNCAPHIVRPMRFILPHNPSIRPAWLIRIGLFLYDFMAPGDFRRSGSLDLSNSQYGIPLRQNLKKGMYYSDCWVDDSRLVIENAMDAKIRGATILTNSECICAKPNPSGDGWVVRLRDSQNRTEKIVLAKIIINAAGPWAEHILSKVIEGAPTPRMRLVQGSHIVVPKLFDHESAYIFQNTDNRIVFAIPYERGFTMVGTTDMPFHGDLQALRPSDTEIDYLCETINHFFDKSLSIKDLVWSFSGVRPLIEDGSTSADKVTRDYRIELNKLDGGATYLSILGGKLTTYRKLAEEAVDKLAHIFDSKRSAWTASSALPGGRILSGSIEAFTKSISLEYPWLPRNLLERYARSYGARINVLLNNAQCTSDLGISFSPDLYEREVQYLVKHEWARTTEDILWRRTKLGLYMDEAATIQLKTWLDMQGPN